MGRMIGVSAKRCMIMAIEPGRDNPDDVAVARFRVPFVPSRKVKSPRDVFDLMWDLGVTRRNMTFVTRASKPGRMYTTPERLSEIVRHRKVNVLLLPTGPLPSWLEDWVKDYEQDPRLHERGIVLTQSARKGRLNKLNDKCVFRIAMSKDDLLDSAIGDRSGLQIRAYRRVLRFLEKWPWGPIEDDTDLEIWVEGDVGTHREQSLSEEAYFAEKAAWKGDVKPAKRSTERKKKDEKKIIAEAEMCSGFLRMLRLNMKVSAEQAQRVLDCPKIMWDKTVKEEDRRPMTAAEKKQLRAIASA